MNVAIDWQSSIYHVRVNNSLKDLSVHLRTEHYNLPAAAWSEIRLA